MHGPHVITYDGALVLRARWSYDLTLAVDAAWERSASVIPSEGSPENPAAWQTGCVATAGRTLTSASR